MLFRMVTSCFFALTFSLCFSISCRANIDGKKWIFHGPNRDYVFTHASPYRGSPMVALEDIAKSLGLKISYDAKTFRILLSDPRNQNSIRFWTYSTRVEGKNFHSELSRHPEFENVRLYVPIDFADRALRPLLTGEAPKIAELPTSVAEAIQPVDIVIDAGHGGNDYGASVKDGKKILREKDLTLEWAKILKTKLEDRQIKTACTRSEDLFLTLPERTRFANERKAKFFLSLHFNFEQSGKRAGPESYILSLKLDDRAARSTIAEENQIIPDNLSDGVERTLSDLRAESNFERSLSWAKVFQAPLAAWTFQGAEPHVLMGPFYVLYGAEMPAVLLELGYLSEMKNRRLLLDEPKRDSLANSLADALATALKKGITQL